MITSAESNTPETSRRARTIVVGVDGSHGAVAAMLFAAGLAGDLDADVVVVHGTLSNTEARPSPDQLDEWCAPLIELNIAYRTVVEAADAVPLLVEVAERCDAFVVVVGATAHSELTEVVLGGVAIELAHHGSRPLVIVPPLGAHHPHG